MPETLIAGRYRLGEPLGQGGMSEVWCATDTELDRRVALKLLAPNADTARFEREARAVAALAHPNVNQLYDYGEDAGRPFMVLEYLPGGTLEDGLRSGPLPDAETEAIAAGIAAGLAHAHTRGVVHRDLKPTNVLFDEEGRAKLADFGIARMTAGESTLTEAGTVLGTAAYISPEQAAGEPATAASDVYSFGVILFRMLTGRPPFDSDDPLELVKLHRDVEAQRVASLRPDVPPALEAVTTASLAKDPGKRPQDGAALLAALGVENGATVAAAPTAYASAEATRVMPVPAVSRKRRPASALAIPAVLVLAVGGAAFAYAVTRSSGSPSPAPPTTLNSPSLPTTTAKRATAKSTTSTAPAISTTPPTTTSLEATPRTVPRTATAPTTTSPAPPTTTSPPTTTTTSATTTSPPTPNPRESCQCGILVTAR